MFATVSNGFPWYDPGTPRTSYGTGTLFKRGNIRYVSFWVDGRQVQKSTGSANIQDAKRLRDQILGK